MELAAVRAEVNAACNKTSQNKLTAEVELEDAPWTLGSC